MGTQGKLYEGKEEMGTITIRTNRMELNSSQVYNIYKQRQAIEQFFKTYDDTLDFEASYMRNNYSNEAMLFLNHLTSVMAISTIEEIDSLGQAKNISYRDLMCTLKKIKAARIDNKWMIPPIKKTVQKNCDKMNLDFNDLSVLGI